MSAHFTEISVGARFAELPGLLEAIAGQAAGFGISADDLLRLQLVAEELFTNTITHGHQGDSEHMVGLSLRREDAVLTLRYEDEAPPFDLTKIPSKTASTVAIGGLGIGLIRGMCKAIRYQRLDQRNITEIEF